MFTVSDEDEVAEEEVFDEEDSDGDEEDGVGLKDGKMIF